MQDPTAGCSPHSPSPIPPHWRTLRVLLADDHRAYRLLIGSFLCSLGLAHETVGDGQAALETLAARPFDLLISDCRMPVMDGYALTLELRRREGLAGTARLPVIALTGCLGAEQIQRCVACGMDDWMLKPITLERLREVLLYWLPNPDVRPHRPRRPVDLARLHGKLPTRASLIATFGFWEVVEPLLFCLMQEAHEDLVVLKQALNDADTVITTQRLHRLVGGLAFLGDTGLEQRAMLLIERVQRTGVAANTSLLKRFERDIEGYLSYLANL
ncbi:response regulator [Pseudomonas sp. FP597]|uniref:response regulator n=1 Tax=Pseudomonas sp. FP597 TaxID=2954096 RepID=UPI0027374E6B|nr:response regulator [Pseudomonas sp. FP597]WLI07841.1 response regulator [Pseudomonas sp. FP597]